MRIFSTFAQISHPMAETAQAQSFSLQHVVEITRKYLWYIGGLTALAALLAILFTAPFIYKPEYRASAIIFPTNPERYDIANLFNDEPTIFLYGDSKEVEKLDRVANSEQVTLFVIDSLNLWKVYGVDRENDPSPKYEVQETYRYYVKTIRTAGNGLEIEAHDIDPERAAAIVNLIIAKTDELNRRMLRTNKASILKVYQSGYAQRKAQLERYTDSLRNVRRQYNIFDPNMQTEIMVEQVMRAEGQLATAKAMVKRTENLAGANSPQVKEAQANMEVVQAKVNALVRGYGGTTLNLADFREGIDQVIALEAITETLAEDLESLENKMEAINLMNAQDYTTIMVPDQAYPSDRKARPVRWVILLASVLVTALVSILGALLIERVTEERKGV